MQYLKFKGGEIMNYVGIDIAKFKHDCFIMTDQGEVIQDTFTFENIREGFNKLLNVLKPLDPSKTRIGFESTGHYAINLKIYLQDNGYSFMELNPLMISRFRKATTLRRTKTDKIDAKMICNALVTMEYKPYPNKVYHIYSLKLLTRFRNKLVRNRSTCLIRLTTILDYIFPEFKPFFNNKFGSTALFILNKYKTPEKISKLTLKSFEEIRLVSRGSFSHIKYLKLIELAKNTVGYSNDILEFQLTSILKLYDDHDKEIKKTESSISDMMSKIDCYSLSIDGIGVTSAASIISEFGYISNFDSPNKMLSFAGLEPGISQSGTQAFKGKMVKHGSSYLRYTLIMVSESLLKHNPKFYEYYLKKRNEGKAHLVALSHVAKKLVRLIYKLETNHIKYDPNYIK